MTDLKQWHKEVCSRDGYICQGCFKDFSFDHYFNEEGVNQYVCGHHIKTQKANPELVYEVSNGVCVCFQCHTKIHKGVMPCPTPYKDVVPEIMEKTAKKMSSDFDKKHGLNFAEVRRHTFPNGQTVTLSHHDKICKCKRYIAVEATGKCMACEKREPMFKAEKKKPKKKS